MSSFTLRFDWPECADGAPRTARELTAPDVRQAAVQAAMLFAGEEFEGQTPTGFQIQSGDEIVYRYPKLAA